MRARACAMVYLVHWALAPLWLTYFLSVTCGATTWQHGKLMVTNLGSSLASPCACASARATCARMRMRVRVDVSAELEVGATEDSIVEAMYKEQGCGWR